MAGVDGGADAAVQPVGLDTPVFSDTFMATNDTKSLVRHGALKKPFRAGDGVSPTGQSYAAART